MMMIILERIRGLTSRWKKALEDISGRRDRVKRRVT